jgi:hypothetical protein
LSKKNIQAIKSVNNNNCSFEDAPNKSIYNLNGLYKFSSTIGLVKKRTNGNTTPMPISSKIVEKKFNTMI